MRYWFVPSDRGDIRLEQLDDASCFLAVKAPSKQEAEVLTRFEAEARSRGWLRDEESPLAKSTKRERRIVLQKSLVDVGPVLVQAAFGVETAVWTAVRSEGRIELHDGVKKPSPEADAAVSLRKPARGCPAPVPTNVRASEVLRTFCTTSQWSEWQCTRSLVAFGSQTGKPYRVYHRNEAARRRMGHILVDARGREMCVWDALVPAEEEVLAAKLAVEHREGWLLVDPTV